LFYSNVPEDRGGFPEMDDYDWVTIDEARKLLHETQVSCLDKVKQLFLRKTKQKEEEILLERYLNGDNTAFGPLYYRYRGLVLYHLNKRLSYLDNEDIEDLAIDFLGRISGKLRLYNKEKGLFRTWMTNCILNFIKEYKNKKSTKEKMITDSITTNNSDHEYYDISIISDDDTLKNVSYLNIIKLIKERLCDDDWKIFELHFLQGYNQAETGERLGLREDTMWFRIKRIRRRLDGIQNL
jgi:RNA polymerase sigma factor (sigma-70 family)